MNPARLDLQKSQPQTSDRGIGDRHGSNLLSSNLQIYDAAEVVKHYANLGYLTACERVLFESYIPQGCSVLDLGVGGGRTTRFLSAKASSYVGADYAPAMVNACRRKFPGLEFMVADTGDLSAFSESAFDAVVFAFNGLDYALVEHSWQKCFEQIGRVLKAGGVVIFSSHNPRAILMRRDWNRERVRQFTAKFPGHSEMLHQLIAQALSVAMRLRSLAQSCWSTVPRGFQRIASRAFWLGEGVLVDPAHGGLVTHYAVPLRVMAAVSALGFSPVRVLGDDYPRRSQIYATDWYYYVFRKSCTK